MIRIDFNACVYDGTWSWSGIEKEFGEGEVPSKLIPSFFFFATFTLISKTSHQNSDFARTLSFEISLRVNIYKIKYHNKDEAASKEVSYEHFSSKISSLHALLLSDSLDKGSIVSYLLQEPSQLRYKVVELLLRSDLYLGRTSHRKEWSFDR